MDLTLFIVFLSLSLILIALGLFKTEHTELSLIGFVFLFLLSFTVINNSIYYSVGKDVNYTYSAGNLTITQERAVSVPFTDNTHYFGYYLVVASVIGFMGVLLGLRHSKGFK